MSRKGITRSGVIVFLALLLVALPLLASCAQQQQPVKEKVIKVGFFYELTGPVQASLSGITLAHYDAYWKWLNETKGGIRGVRVEHMWYDGAYNVDRAVSGYKFFKDAGVLVIEPWTSVTGEPLLELSLRDEIPMVSHWASDKALDPQYWYYTYCPTFTQFYTTVLKWIKETDWKESRPPRVAQIANKVPMGMSHIEPSTPYAAKLGIELGPFEYIPMMPLDVTSELLRIRDAKADYVYIPSNTAVVGVILRDAKKLGLQDKFKWVMGPMIMKWEGLPFLSDLSDGLIGITYDIFPEENLPAYRFNSEILERYIGKNTQVGRVHYGGAFTNLLEDQLVITEAIGRAIDKVGYDKLNGRAVKEALDTLKDFDVMGVSPPVTYGPNKREGQNKSRLGKIVWKGPEGVPTVVPVTDWIAPPAEFSEPLKVK